MAEFLVANMSGEEVRERAHELSALLRDGFAAGAALGFLVPVDDAELDQYWASVASEIETRRRTLISAQREIVVGGMVQVVPDTAANGRHRAEVQKLVVAENERGHGLARRLLEAAEQTARSSGIRLLYLSTHAHMPAEALYRATGWRETGSVPGWAIVPGGDAVENVFFWKAVS
ncbi:MAG: GNAT family N-acetyltransferase [Acidimicrobiales bacterium]